VLFQTEPLGGAVQNGSFGPLSARAVGFRTELLVPAAPPNFRVVNSGASSLTVAWDPAVAGTASISGYRLVVNGSVFAELPEAVTQAVVPGLATGQAHALEVMAFDDIGGTSDSATLTGWTWLSNPAPVQASPRDKALDLSWPAASPPLAAKEYRIYRATSPFSTVSGLTAALTVNGNITSASLTNLPNGVAQYVAVTVVNTSGGMDPSISPISAVPVDDAPPLPPANVWITGSGAHSLDVAFAPSADIDGDLAGYRVYANGVLASVLTAAETSTTLNGLAPAAAISVGITAVDLSGNESAPSAALGYTWLVNPASVTPQPVDNGLIVAFGAAQPQAGVQAYRLYVNPQPFQSVAGLLPAAQGSGSPLTVAGLTNGSPVFVAVSVVNKSGGENPLVASIQATPQDLVPPSPPTNLVVSSPGPTSLLVGFGPPANPAADLAGFRVKVAGTVAANLALGQTTALLEGLAPASQHSIAVVAVDDDGLESTALTALGHTWLANPTLTSVSGHDRRVAISFAPSTPTSSLAHYAVYVQTSNFASVAGLTPWTTLPPQASGTNITGLTNGVPVWVAVVAVNKSGGYSPSVSSQSATPVDDAPPPPPSQLTVTASTSSSLSVSWLPSAPVADVAHYALSLSGQVVAQIMPPQTSYTVGSLAPSSAYPLSVTAVDALGNTSAPASVMGYTELGNPTTVSITAELHTKLSIAWSPVQPSGNVGGYRVYVSTQNFASVQGLVAAKTIGPAETSTTLTGLINGTTVFVAVTAFNKSGFENQAVTPVAGTPVKDTLGPTIASVSFAGAPVVDGTNLSADGHFSAAISDPEGVQFARFRVDGTIIAVDQVASDGWTAPFSPDAYADGPHTLTVEAFDSHGNMGTLTRAFTSTVPAPPAPLITAPSNGAAVSSPTQLVQGSGKAGTTAKIFRNGQLQPNTGLIDAAGKWSVLVALEPGNNTLRATATSAGGESALGPPVSVLYDNTVLAQPKGLQVDAREGGEVQLGWFSVADTSLSGLKGYRVYRASQAFTLPNQATLLTPGELNKNPGFSDLPPADGEWFYAVAAESNAGTMSPLSAVASGMSDGTPPRATSIAFAPKGASDPTDGRVGVGPLEVTITFDEPLLTDPFSSLTVPGAQPIPVGLGLLSDSQGLIYRGTIQVTPATPSGLAQAVLSARDLAGNRGTLIEGASTVLLDTDAPDIDAISLAPGAPIQNDEAAPISVAVEVLLSEPLPLGLEPELTWALSSSSSTPELLPLTQVEPHVWTGSLALPAQAGLVPELLLFSYLGSDDLGNTSSTIFGKSSFEVYQGELPALQAPLGLAATALPAGKIALNWSDVGQAAEYQIYRRGPAESAFSPLTRTVASEYTDDTPADGAYAYAVASIRKANGQESESPQSPVAQATADSTPPAGPTNLTATLASNGIALAWQAAAPATEPVKYRLYRSSGLEITSIEGLAPLVHGIAQLIVVDPTPSLTDHAYVVAAEDAVGNVSAPSNSVYLNPGLLPVSSITLTHNRGANLKPRLDWTHPSASIASYAVHLNGAPAATVSAPTVSWTHTTHLGGAATYGVVAIDNGGQQSLERTISLFDSAAQLAATAQAVRGHIAPVEFLVSSEQALEGASLRVNVAGRTHLSAPFSVSAGQTTSVPVVIGGYPELGAVAQASVTTRLEPNPGERIDIIESVPIPTRTDAYVAQVTDLDLQRGSTGTARFSFTNTGPLPVELVLAQSSGNAASNQVRFSLLDTDGNVLSTAAAKQSGSGTVALSTGAVVARVQPGDTFASDAMPLPVPQNAPDSVVVRLTIDEIHHELGKPTAVKIPGFSTQAPGTLVLPPYSAAVTSVAPQQSFGDVPIVISGAAVRTDTNTPAANEAVTLIIRLAGFERSNTVYTNAAGDFTHSFTPGPNEGGVYDVWAKYPGLLTASSQAQFSVQRVQFSPAKPQLTLAQGFEAKLQLGVATSQGTPLTNLRLQAGALPTGLTVVPAPPQTWTSQTTGFVTATVVASATAPTQGTFPLTLLSDERSWGNLSVAYTVTAAEPKLVAKPTFVETGAVRGELVMEQLLVSNVGLTAANDVTFELLNASKTAPAASWVSIASAKSLPVIGPSSEIPVALSFAPPASTALSGTTPYSFWLRARVGGATLLEVPVYAWVSEFGTGKALFHVIDMYTGTTANNTGLVGAKVKLDRLLGAPLTLNATTGLGGEVLINDVPAGNYRYRISAADHEAVEGNIQVKPSLTTTETVFLPMPYITIEWDVTETTVEDSYTVALTATFETDVPAPVVIVEPASIPLPELDPGEVFLGELTIRNYGLIKAEQSKFQLPNGGSEYKFELLAQVPSELAAGQAVVVPYRITKLDGDSVSGSSSGGGCCGVSAYWGGFSYGWMCIGGQWVWGAFPVVYLRSSSSCCAPGSPGPITAPPSGPGGGAGCCGGSSSGPSWKATESKEKPCDPCEHPSLSPIEKECCHSGKGKSTNSEVDMITGEYRDVVEDLPIEVLGWRVPFLRSYTRGEWNIELQRSDLTFSEANGELTSITYDGVLFTAANDTNTVFEAGDGLALFAVNEGGAAWKMTSLNSSTFWFDDSGKLLRIVNARGHHIAIGRDAQGRPNSLSDTQGVVFAELAYDAQGRVTSISAADGRTVTYAWTNGRLTQVTDPEGRVTSYEYDSKGQITKKSYPSGRVDNLVYSSTGMVTSQLDGQGNGFYFDYGYNQATQQFYSAVTHTDGRLEERWFSQSGTLLLALVDGAEQGQLADGATVEVDANGNVTGARAPDGTVLDTTVYDSLGRVLRTTDARGFVTAYTYDSAGNLLTEVVRNGLQGPVLSSLAHEYDNYGRRTATTQLGLNGAPDQVTAYSYDAANNVIHEVTSDGVEVTRTFDNRGLLTSETDATGNTVSWEYDGVGRLVERRFESAADGTVSVESWVYTQETDSSGAVIGARTVYTDPDGRETTERFDPNGLPVEIIDAWGRSTKTTYDSMGDLVKLVTAEGVVTEFERETLPSGFRRTTRKVDGEVIDVEERDKYDRIVRREVAGEEVTFFYDGSYPNPAEEVRPGAHILYQYDHLGNRTQVRTLFDTGEETLETSTFDGLRRTSHTNALGQTITEQFDASDQLVRATHPSGKTVDIGRDGLGRPESYLSPSGDSALAVQYGAGFQVAERTLPNGASYTYSYDTAGQLTGLQTSFGLRVELDVNRQGLPLQKRWYSGATDTTPDEVANYGYDSAGQRTLAQNPTVTISTERDYFARTTTTTYDFGAFSKSFTTVTDSLGRTTGLVMPDGTSVGYEYDGLGRLDLVVLPNNDEIDIDYPNSTTVERHYPNGVVWTDSRNPVLAPRSVTAYNAAGAALMDWQYTLAGPRVTEIATERGDFGFTYDADGQVIAATYPTLSADGFTYDTDANRTSSLSTGTAPWTYSAADELLTIGSDQSFGWAPSGDLTSRTVGGVSTTYEYDSAGRLSLVRNAAGQVVAEYGYDADGLRVVKKVGDTTTYAIYSEQGLLAEYDATGAELRRYVWMPRAEWQSDLLVYGEGGASYFPLLDAGGEVQKLTDSAGEVAWEVELRVFGEALVLPGNSVEFPIRPSAQYYDAETGLHYNLFRIYDPALGRYLSLDPLLEAGGGHNLYGFAHNNPVEFADLMGLSTGYDGGDCMANFKAGLDFSDASCSLKFKLNPLVSIKVKVGIKSNRQDCCKDGKLIKQGKGCLEVRGTISGEVGIDPSSYPGIDALAKKAGVKADIKVITVAASLGCNYCSKCGESGYGANFDKCCADLEVEGPSFSFSYKAVKITLKTGKVTLGKICIGPYGWSMAGPSTSGPSAGSGGKW
jgi:RHS repeat-associated protein